MQLKLVALLAFAVASVSGTATVFQLSSEFVVFSPYWPSQLLTPISQEACKCAGHSYSSSQTQDAIDQAGSGTFHG